jgi:hypothetical protein
MENWWNDNGRGKKEVLETNLFSVPFCSPQNLHGPAWE